MSERDYGGSAFPHNFLADGGPADTGMTVRDYFAAKALVGLLAEPQWGSGHSVTHSIGPQTNDQAKNHAVVSYIIADAMLEARK